VSAAPEANEVPIVQKDLCLNPWVAPKRRGEPWLLAESSESPAVFSQFVKDAPEYPQKEEQGLRDCAVLGNGAIVIGHILESASWL
jgi:hypothetical protein